MVYYIKEAQCLFLIFVSESIIIFPDYFEQSTSIFNIIYIFIPFNFHLIIIFPFIEISYLQI